MDTNVATREKDTWWGDYQLAIGQQIQFTFDGLTLSISRHPHEWQCHYIRTKATDNPTWTSQLAPLNEAQQPLVPNSPSHSNSSPTIERYIINESTDLLSIQPKTGDRPFIIRPSLPFSIPGTESTTVYVSTALWIGICIGKNRQEVASIPIQLPSESWIGPNSMIGELCYASRSAGRLDLNLLPKNPARITTPVFIQNKGDDTLLLERFSLPVPHLSVFAADTGLLWSEPVSLHRDKDPDAGKVSIDNRAPKEAGQAVKISEPRIKPKSNQIAKAVSQLFG